MTISHPSNVKNILSSGIDSLVISMNIAWDSNVIFKNLDELKEKAKQNSIDYQGQLKHFNINEIFPFTIKPHGTRGYSWILTGHDFTYKIANSNEPSSRPNAMVEFRSEALWRLGAENILNIALKIIEANGGHILESKPSRVDLCLDFLMPEKKWSHNLLKYAVTRATDYAPYYRNKYLTGIRLGKGDISVRLYDKPSEIEQQSKKYWMYDIWGIQEIPEKKKIIRIEFQLRRGVLQDLKINGIHDLFQNIDGIWAYCTKNWLKFQDRPGLHHTQRSTFKWYEEIQNGFRGVQGANPLIRKKAVSTDKKKLMQQANGLIQSLHAIEQEENDVDRNEPVKIEDCLDSYINELKRNSPNPTEVKDRITKKRARYHREETMIKEGYIPYRLIK